MQQVDAAKHSLQVLVSVVNDQSRTLQALQADVAVLVEVMLQRDAEVAELRAWAAELERRLDVQTEWASEQAKVTLRPISMPTYTIVTTTDGTGHGN